MAKDPEAVKALKASKTVKTQKQAATKHHFALLEERIGHAFANPGLLRLAITHVSASARREESYQRLEFLGDRVLGLAISAMLYAQFPQAAEGELSRRLAELVRKETCAQVAATWGVSPYVRLGLGEQQSGGAQKTAILGDVCEAIIGALYLDAGYEAAAAIVQKAFAPLARRKRPSLRDPKSALQEWAQGRALAAPSYRLDSQSGPDHAPFFTIAALVDGFAPAIGEGASKRAAEQAAAELFLAREKIWPDQKARI